MSQFENLSDAVDVHYKVEKLRVGRELRLVAKGKAELPDLDYKKNKRKILKAGQDKDPVCAEVHARLVSLEQYLEDQILPIIQSHPVWLKWAKYVRGVSPMLLAKAMGRCAIEIIATASKMRAHCGLRPDQGLEKGKKLDYDAGLKSVLWLIGRQLRFATGVYYEHYLKWKDYYTKRCETQGIKILATPSGRWACKACGVSWDKKKDITPCCPTPNLERLVKKEPPGFMYKGHLDLMAMRKMISLFAIHLWSVWREAEGLPVPELWILSGLAGPYRHTTYIPPLKDDPEKRKRRRKQSG